MFKEIKIPENLTNEVDESTLENLSKINIFVGQNNSRKSRIIRSLFSAENLNFVPNDLDLDKINLNINVFKGCVSNGESKQPSSKWPIIKQELNKLLLIDFISISFSPKDFYNPYLAITNMEIPLEFSKQKLAIRKAFDETFHSLNELLPESYSYNYDKMYIPSLRGLRPLHLNNKKEYTNEDLYLYRTSRDYFKGKETLLEDKIYTGLSLFEDLTNLLMSTSEGEKKKKNFQEFLSKNFFNSAEVVLTPNKDNNIVFIKIDNENDRPVHELGDGIQMIIILTYPLFFSNEQFLKVYIEEPELYLHPGMQRILLNTFIDYKEFSDYQFFISTHSNHLLDMTLDFDNISVYFTEKNTQIGKTTVEIADHGDIRLLSNLGVKNSSVFLSNATIWVEGISDRIYLRKYLEVYFNSIDKVYIEDIHFSFVEYGGNGITHWSFLDDEDSSHRNINVDRLCAKLFLIADNDGAGFNSNGKPPKNKSKKAIRHEKLEKSLGDRYYRLASREIENLIAANILKKIINIKEGSNAVNLEFSNWNLSKYKEKKLGDFIEKNVKNINRKYADDSGTLYDKVNFSKLCVKEINCLDDLSEEAKDLCGKICSFIEK